MINRFFFFLLTTSILLTFANLALAMKVEQLPGTIFINPGDVNASTNLPVNSYLTGWIVSEIVPTYRVEASAEDSGTVEGAITISTTDISGIGANGVFQTNIPGVGFIIDASGVLSGEAANYVPVAVSGIAYLGSVMASTNLEVVDQVRVRLVKTGDIPQGGSLTGKIASIRLHVSPNTGASTIEGDYPVAFNGGNIQISSCVVTNTNILVNMGDVQMDDFKGEGSSTPSHSIPITLKCDGDTDMAMTLMGLATSQEGVLALDGKGATGVGIEVLYDDKPFPLNQQQNVHLTGDTEHTLNLQARYYELDKTITPGSADSHATLTLTYS